MKTSYSRIFYFGVMMFCYTLFNSETTYSQTIDSLSHPSNSNGAFQFQLLGGIGIYYIGELNSVSHFRIGADVSLNHSDQSGNNSGSSTYTSEPPLYSSSSSNSSEPNQTGNSYQISLSALYLHNLVEYKQSTMYAGVGPLLSYYWNRSISKYPSTSTYSSTTTYSNSSENTSKTSSIGPLSIFGVKSKLVEYVDISAEISLSAVYQWTFQSSSFSSTNGNLPSYTSTSSNNNISRLSGWSVSINAIRIGLIINL